MAASTSPSLELGSCPSQLRLQSQESKREETHKQGRWLKYYMIRILWTQGPYTNFICYISHSSLVPAGSWSRDPLETAVTPCYRNVPYSTRSARAQNPTVQWSKNTQSQIMIFTGASKTSFSTSEWHSIFNISCHWTAPHLWKETSNLLNTYSKSGSHHGQVTKKFNFQTAFSQT